LARGGRAEGDCDVINGLPAVVGLLAGPWQLQGEADENGRPDRG